MTEEQLQAIRSRCEAATPGPWHEWYIGKVPSGIICDALENGMAQTFNRIDESYPNAGANAFFIAHAREDVPVLLTEVADLRRQLNEAQAELKIISDALDAVIAERNAANDEIDSLKQQLSDVAMY